MNKYSEQIIEKLNKVKSGDYKLMLDNDCVSAYHEDDGFDDFDLMPHELLEALLDDFGIKWEYV